MHGKNLDGMLPVAAMNGAGMLIFALLATIGLGIYFLGRWANQVATPIPTGVMMLLVPVVLVDVLYLLSLVA